MSDVWDYKLTVEAEGGAVGEYVEKANRQGSVVRAIASCVVLSGAHTGSGIFSEPTVQFIAVSPALGERPDRLAMLRAGIAAVEAATDGLLGRAEKLSVTLERDDKGPDL